uniref:Ig-like domain-containing protein n=1 Tax=Anopheles culicifacies TaxID=139723 RepID=A0A182LWK2_9DIPT
MQKQLPGAPGKKSDGTKAKFYPTFDALLAIELRYGSREESTGGGRLVDDMFETQFHRVQQLHPTPPEATGGLVADRWVVDNSVKTRDVYRAVKNCITPLLGGRPNGDYRQIPFSVSAPDAANEQRKAAPSFPPVPLPLSSQVVEVELGEDMLEEWTCSSPGLSFNVHVHW